MELTIELQGLIALGVGSLVTYFVTQLAKRGFDFSGYQSQITAGIVSALVVVINAVFAKVPADSVHMVQAAMQVIVVLFGAFGIHGFIKSRQ